MRKRKVFHINLAAIILGLILAPSLLLNLFFISKQPARGEYKVLAVLDGDTIVLENKVRLRLRNIDAPELEFCGGKESKRELQQLIGSHNIDIKEQILDQQGRPMALIYIGKTLINNEMLLSGWAKYHHDQSTQAKQLKQTADQAKAQNLGLYGQCISLNPPNPNCSIKGNIDNNSPYTKRYYIPGCVHYNTTIVELNDGEQWFCSEAEAVKTGYKKANRCP